MASEHGPRGIRIDPSDLAWDTPAQALQRLAGLAALAAIEPHDRGKSLPAKHRLQILGRLVHHLFPDGTTEHLPQAAATLPEQDRRYLARLIHDSRRALEKRQQQAPATLLGFPTDVPGTWANLLDQGWIPWQPGWIGRLRS